MKIEIYNKILPTFEIDDTLEDSDIRYVYINRDIEWGSTNSGKWVRQTKVHFFI